MSTFILRYSFADVVPPPHSTKVPASVSPAGSGCGGGGGGKAPAEPVPGGPGGRGSCRAVCARGSAGASPSRPRHVRLQSALTRFGLTAGLVNHWGRRN